MNQQLQDKLWDISDLMMIGLEIGLILFVISASIRLGWKLSPYIFAIALIIYVLLY